MVDIIIGSRTFPIRFSVNAVDAIQGKFGAVENITEVMQDLSSMNWLLSLLINEGLAYQYVVTGSPFTPVSESEIGTLMTWGDYQSRTLGEKILEAFNEGMNFKKKMTMEDLQVIAKANASGRR